jgi:hypothetical protein
MTEVFRWDRDYRLDGPKTQVDSLVRAFNNLPGRLGARHMQKALRRGIKPYHPVLRAATPVRTGGLRRSVKTIIRTYGKTQTQRVVGIVGYGRGGSDGKKGYHSAVVERGTAERFTTTRRRRGSMPARRMLRDTIAANQSAILANITAEMAVSLERAAAELAREQGRGRYRGY